MQNLLPAPTAANAGNRRITPPAKRRPVPVELIGQKIYVIRRQKVMLDSGLAELYRVGTKALNRAVKRNPARFPVDFMFRLTDGEAQSLRRQNGTSNDGRGGRRRKMERLEQTQQDHDAVLSIVVKDIQNIEKKVKRGFKSLRTPNRRKPRIGFITEKP